MKERPILFSGPMVRALLDGRKTQTRRIAKIGPDYDDVLKFLPIGSVWLGDGECADALKCPYGQSGDRLWVRETFAHAGERGLSGPPFLYRADPLFDGCTKGEIPWDWKPSIFCTRAASRITLEVISVRVERLNAISAADSIAEGIRVEKGSGMIEGQDCYMMTTNSGYMRGPAGAVVAYENLWESINGPGSWALNPWVWAVEFKML